MAEFVVRSSILRRTLLLALLFPLIFVGDFLSTYWTNRRLVNDLGVINRTDAGTEAVAQASTSIASAMDALRSHAEKPNPAKQTAFFENLKHAEGFVERFRGTPAGERVLKGIRSVRDAGERSVQLPSSPAVRSGEVLIASQFSLETEEELRKIQFGLKEEGRRAFARIYDDRWFPLVVTTVLDCLFFLALALVVVPLLRSLRGSVNNLTDATDRIMAGEADYQAPILGADELGKVTDAFNRVVASLHAKEKENQARVAAELARLEFISQSAEELAQSIEFEQILARLAHAAVPFLGDWCVVDAVGADGEIRRAAIAHRDPAKLPLVKALQAEGPTRIEQSLLLSKVFESRRAIDGLRELPELFSGTWPGRDRVREIGAKSILSVPIIVRQKIAAILTMCVADREHAYGRKDLLVAEDLARRTGYAIENARLLREAKEAIQTRDDFLSIASHELRTPLTPLRMQVQMLGRSLDRAESLSGDRVRGVISTCERMISRLTRLVEDLLEVSRINSGRIELRYERFDVVPLVREVLDRFQMEIDRAGSRVDLRAPESLESTLDPGKFEQVFVNLLTNALKYGDRKPIRVELEKTEESLRLRVIDHGIGIPEKDRTRIFGRFERAWNTSSISGLGLGLFITSQIVELHGGKITVDSEPGKGSTFAVELPLRPKATPPDPSAGRDSFGPSAERPA